MRKLHGNLAAVLIVLTLIVLTLIVLAGCGGPPYTFHGTEYKPIIAAPEISGSLADDKSFQLSKLNAKVKLVFFGYTSCPDVCPLTLANMKAVYEKLSHPEQQQVAAIFVSVDPDRDTPERLAEYVRSFNPAFYGVHVPDATLEEVKQGYGVFAEKRPVSSTDSAAGYLVDHTAVVYVIDKNNNLREIFPSDAAPGDIAADVDYLLKQ